MNEFSPEIHENNLYFAAIIGINGSRRIEHSDTVPHCEARAWAHLSFGSDAAVQCAMPVGIMRAIAGGDDDGCVRRNRGEKVETCGELALVGRQRQIGAVRQPQDLQLDLVKAKLHFSCYVACSDR